VLVVYSGLSIAWQIRIRKNTMTQKQEEMIAKNTNGQDNASDTTLPNQQKEWQGKHIMDYNN
jgi:hypothetical protein